MIAEKQIRALIEQHLDGSDLFVVDIVIKPGNKIFVFIDGDHRVTIDACTKLSRFVESGLDRETEDFDLTVSSTGADRPLKLPRQFVKNTGLLLELVTISGENFTGTVLHADDQGIEIERQADDKSKKKVERCLLSLKYSEIKSAKEVITFKK